MRRDNRETHADDGWAPNGLAVRQARAHLASLSKERREQLEREWSR